MRIVQVVTRSDNIGGSQIHVRDLSIELCNRGMDICILVGGQGPFFHEIQRLGISVYSIPHLIRDFNPLQDWWAFWEIRRYLKMFKPDIVALHNSKAGLIGRMAAWSLGIPAVFTAHGWWFIQNATGLKRKLLLLTERVAGLLSDGIIAVSDYDRMFCLTNQLASDSKIVKISNGIPDLHAGYANPSVTPVKIITVARLERPKNHLFLLEALAQINCCKWQLDIVGEGPERNEIEKCIERLNLSEKVHLRGARRDVDVLLGKAQIFVLISDMEGLPISILEAMRAGLPVIASDVGGVREQIKKGVNGYLISNDNSASLVYSLKRLCSERELRIKMGLASKEMFKTHFSIRKMVDKTLELYVGILNGKKGNAFHG